MGLDVQAIDEDGEELDSIRGDAMSTMVSAMTGDSLYTDYTNKELGELVEKLKKVKKRKVKNKLREIGMQRFVDWYYSDVEWLKRMYKHGCSLYASF